MTNATTEAGQARAARIAGAMYLIALAAAVLGEYFVRASLIVRGDPTQTAQNIIEHERLFRIGIASDLVSFTGIVVLTLALYVLLKPVNEDLAMLAAFWWLAEAAILCVSTLGNSIVLALLSGADFLKTFAPGQLHSLAGLALSSRAAGYNIGLILFGLGSTVFSYLLLKSGYVPKALAAWGVFASLLVLMSAFWIIVFPDIPKALQLVSPAAIFIYEVALGSWLLLKGARIQSSSASAA
ncbi:MAG: DUF4386 domain-containing protein [Gemmatimonadetes bacterium]|uniref:DUF4386 domain-containing protein n=1 Tax=Candidatus Kutchimonas denitrificans TaxID=3056748 RepID=A0AAE5CCA5_9BACT|nr:DUF4386 domain-containing protein [Gemmatimonadota bacterium]NIR75588.1 DUF4386 domain-containing protein [Candidatus Kutchimonas denitrificans]NIS01902.1 DUF4386 domain-containing protein [Gemmatimonadota bacterium]NIT67683.1 DUF4386 domain-containing protein [Gemmatimonadota bacterium]NIU53557.1 DUF4386 family protein [Gemmatimonadota bacterium]